MKPELADAVEAVVKHHNTAELTEGRMLRKILREVRPFIDEIELSVLLFIFDRTYTYGKAEEVIPMKHFLEGVRLGSGELIHPPVRCKRTKVYDALQRLVDNVIILRSNATGNSAPRYAINPVWHPPVSARADSGIRRGGQHPPSQRTHNSIDINRRDTQQVALRASAREEEMQSARERLAATVTSATEKSKAARTKNKSKQNATGLMKIWEDAFIGTYPEETYFRWRVYEQSAFKKAVERGVPSNDIAEFVAFCVTAFDNVINEHFVWMKAKPTIPNVGFVTKHIAEFYQSFNDSKDPNRRLRGRIKRTEVTDAEEKQQPVDTPAEVQRLRKENEKLKERLGVRSRSRRKAIKTRIATRPTSDDEFGSWD